MIVLRLVAILFLTLTANFAFAAPSTNPPLGGVIQVNTSAPEGSLILDATGAITTGIWKATALGISYGGTGSTQTGDTNCPGASCVTGIRTNLGLAAAGSNSDITSLSPTGNLILTPTGNVGVGTPSPASKFHVFSGAQRMMQLTYDDTTDREYEFASGVIMNGDNSDLQIGPITNGLGLYLYGRSSTGVANGLGIDRSGNVGIGTTVPDASLVVQRDSNSVYSGVNAETFGGSLILRNWNTTASNNSTLAFSPGNSGVSAGITAIFNNHTTYATDLAFLTHTGGGYNEKMRITAAGNVGIGTTSPSANLTVSSGTTSPGTLSIVSDSTNGGSVSGELMFRHTGAFNSNKVASIYALNTGNVGGWTTGDLVFNTGSGTASELTEKMRILSTGNVGIGTATPGTYKLNVNGNTNITGNLTVSGTCTGCGGSYSAGTGLSLSGTTFSLATPVAIANGGTGATTASGARTNLGLSATGSTQVLDHTDSYTSLDISGSNNGYSGITFRDVTGRGRGLMVHNTADIQGFYTQPTSQWSWYFQDGALTVGTIPVGRITGTLPVSNGGTGTTSSTGSGSLVLSSSPSLTGTPTAPTPTGSSPADQIANKGYVDAAVSGSSTRLGVKPFFVQYAAGNTYETVVNKVGPGRLSYTTIRGSAGYVRFTIDGNGPYYARGVGNTEYGLYAPGDVNAVSEATAVITDSFNSGGFGYAFEFYTSLLIEARNATIEVAGQSQ